MDPHANQEEDYIIDDHVGSLVPAQHLESFIVALVFQEAMDKMVILSMLWIKMKWFH